MDIEHVILRPVLTEKATELANDQVYLFYVNPRATKHLVKNALEKIYGVSVGDVRITVRTGKVRKFGKRQMRKQMPDKKIAYVKVTKGKIELFPKP